jgi:hypothetical protein
MSAASTTLRSHIDFISYRYYYIHYAIKKGIRDTMISTLMMNPNEMMEHLAKAAKAKRLALDLSQRSLSDRSGVSYGVLKKFERTGQISLESLLKLALSLDALEGFYDLFEAAKPEEAMTLDELMQDTTRKRGRK